MLEQRYPHVELSEQDDSPRPIRNVQNRTILMVSEAYRGFHKAPTYVYDGNFATVIGISEHRASVALEAMFSTYNPPLVLVRRVLSDYRNASSKTTEGIRAIHVADADTSVDVVITQGATSVTIPVTITTGMSLVAIAGEIIDQIQASSQTLVEASLDASDTTDTRVKLVAKTTGVAGNSIKYHVTTADPANALVMAPTTDTYLAGGTDGPTKAKLEIPTATTALWKIVSNFPGVCGNDLNVNVYKPTSPGALFSFDLLDEFMGNTVTRFQNQTPQKTDFQEDGSGYGYRYLRVASDLFTVYYAGDINDIKAPLVMPDAPPVWPNVQYSLSGGDDGSAATVADYLREVEASALDEATIVMCPDDLPSADKNTVNAALAKAAKNATELTMLRQAVIQTPLSQNLTADTASNGDVNGFVVSCCTRHTGVWRPQLPANSYTADIFVAAAMAVKLLHVSLADRQAVAPVSGLLSTSFDGADPSRNITVLNSIQDTGHEAIVLDPGSRAFQFLTGRACSADQALPMSRANNRQLENQFRQDIFYMLQAYKSTPVAGMLRALREQVNNYFTFQKDIVKSIQSFKSTVADSSNNPTSRVQAGWARADFYWAPKLIGDKIQGVIHTYVDSGL